MYNEMVGLPLVPLGQGLSTVLPVWVWGQSMARLLVASQKRLGVGGSSGIVGCAVTEPRPSSNGSLPSLGSAPAMVGSTCPFTLNTAVVVTSEVALGNDGEAEKPSMAGTTEERRVSHKCPCFGLLWFPTVGRKLQQF